MIHRVRVRLSNGETVIIRTRADDAHWREKALAGVDPLSPLAFAVRKAPPTPAEIAAWNDYVRRQDLADELRELSLRVRELQSALLELGGAE